MQLKDDTSQSKIEAGKMGANDEESAENMLKIGEHNIIGSRSKINVSIIPETKKMPHMKWLVLIILCLQNSLFTVLRRYSQGVLKETYSKHEVLCAAEVIKIMFSAYIIYRQRVQSGGAFKPHMLYLLRTSKNMFLLSLIYGLMNILSYIALQNVSAGVFTICAQLKILSTATFSTVMLNRKYSWVQWRALASLLLGVLLFSEPTWNSSTNKSIVDGNFILGTSAVLIEVTLSGFASIYFEKVVKTDVEDLNIWERNFQLAFGSFPVYFLFIIACHDSKIGYLGGWSLVTFVLATLGAAGGLLVALSIKYGDAILKTLATAGAIVISSIFDYILLDGSLTAVMILAGGVVISAIIDYSFDPSPRLPGYSKYSSTKQ